MIVPVQEFVLPEAHSQRGLELLTNAMLLRCLPGFVMPEDAHLATTERTILDIERAHKRNTRRLRDAIKPFHPHKTVTRSPLSGFTGLSQKEIGDLHTDLTDDADSAEQEVGSRLEPFVHTTKCGEGDVFIAQIGTDPQVVFTNTDDVEDGTIVGAVDDYLHELLLNGLVETKYMSPIVYRTRVNSGMSLVLSGGNDVSAAWHRMDTDQTMGDRFVTVTRLCDSIDRVGFGLDTAD